MTTASSQSNCSCSDTPTQGSCIIFSANGVGLGTFPIPALQPGQALVQTTLSCVSPGTELRELGKMLNGTSEHADKTIVPGYARVGRVIDPGDTGIPNEQRVVITEVHHPKPHVGQWGGQASHAICTAKQMIMIPDDIDDVQAVIARLAAISCHGFRTTQRFDDDHVVVIGLGAIGLFSAKFYACHGYDVVGMDRSPQRVELAKQWGINAQVVTQPLAKQIRQQFTQGADIIVDATGVPAVVRDAVEGLYAPDWNIMLDKHVRYVFQGSYLADIDFNYWPFFNREAMLLFPRDWEPSDLPAIFEMIRQDKMRFTESLYTMHTPSEAPAVYETLKNPAISQVTALFKWDV